MRGYTLISLLGTGMFKKEGGYEPTTYQFPKGETFTTNIFLEAILEAEYKPVKKVLLLGTRTSSWDVLLADIKRSAPGAEDHSELWTQVLEACQSAGISDDLVQRLQTVLSEKLAVPAVIKVHTPVIDAETIPEIFQVYNSLIPEIFPDTDILLDITHGFRSMPILVYQALQFGLAGFPHCKVELVYGELVRGKEHYSNARDLSQYWQLSALTEAKNLFVRRLDGKMLARLLESEWPDGAKLLSKFSAIAECNFSLEIPQWIAEAKRTLARPVTGAEQEWVLEIREILHTDIIKKIDYQCTSDILRAYAHLLETRGLFVQAIITLQAALETRTIEAFGSPLDIGNYGAWQRQYRQYYLKARIKWNVSSALSQVEIMRNKIAHGGYKDKRKDKRIKSTADEIQRILKDSKQGVRIYFSNIKPKKVV